MSGQHPAPAGVDPNIPGTARVHDDAPKGGGDYAVDRAAAEKVFAPAPEMPRTARRNGEFPRRAVRYPAIEAGAPRGTRSHAEVTGFFDGLDLAEPGPVTAPQWRPGIARKIDPGGMRVLAGVGRKP